jgi:hypothetical protein
MCLIISSIWGQTININRELNKGIRELESNQIDESELTFLTVFDNDSTNIECLGYLIKIYEEKKEYAKIKLYAQKLEATYKKLLMDLEYKKNNFQNIHLRKKYEVQLKETSLMILLATSKISDDNSNVLENIVQNSNTKEFDDVHSLPPILSIESIELSKDILLGGESVQLSITLKNSGPGDAKDVFANLSCNLSDISLPDRIIFPVIKAKNGVETLTLDFNGGFELLTAEAIIKIEVVEPNFKIRIQGKQLRFPTRAFQNPELILAQYAVIENQSANPNNQIDINEMIDLKIAIQNIGQGNAENVKVSVENQQKGVMFLGIGESMKRDNPSFQGINSGKFETVSYKYFVNSDFTDDRIEFAIRTDERHGKYGFNEKKSFPINKQLEETGQIRRVAIVEENRNKKVVIEDIPDFVVDVDTDIPTTNSSQTKSYALIIGNEDYKSKQIGLTAEQNVDYAINDALIFSQYCKNTFGIPSKQIKVLQNATAAEMNRGIAWLKNLTKLEEGNAKVIFYYSGHGLPHEQTKEAYLIPTDVAGTNLEYAIKLNDVYKSLTEYPALQVNVFLDACFSGGGRNQGLLAMKGIRIKPKGNQITGNLVVFSSSTGNESSAVYRDKQHGYFTYYLLKKLKDTKGEVTLEELGNYVVRAVSRETTLDGMIQTPQINFSPQIESKWGNLKLK